MISLRSKTAQKILTVFFLNEKERFYVNELAKMVNEDPSNVHKKLVQLKNEGVILDEFQGKERFFFLNKKYLFLKEYKKIILKEAGFENLLRESLKQIRGIKKAYLFGSYAKNKLSKQSDIDLLVIGEFDTIILQRKILEIQKNIGREINPIEMSVKEFDKRMMARDQFLQNIFSEKHIKIV